MIKIVFKNMDSSELAREAVKERLETLVDKFQLLIKSRILVTLEMENSPNQAGPDLFKVSVQVSGGLYGGVRITKSASNLYAALAEVVDHLLVVFNRFSDKIRVKNRNKSRKHSRVLAFSTDLVVS